MLYLGALFLVKVLDNALSTTKTILIQRSRWVLAGIAVILSDFLYFWITKRIVSADSMLALTVVAAAGGVGCSLACLVSDKRSKDRTYVNVILSDNLEAMQAFRDCLAEHHITNVAADTYTLDWNTNPSMPTIDIPGMPGAQMGMLNLSDLLGKPFGDKYKTRKMTVGDAYKVLMEEECDKLLDNDTIIHTVLRL